MRVKAVKNDTTNGKTLAIISIISIVFIRDLIRSLEDILLPVIVRDRRIIYRG